jgi:hypothetical protein
MARGSSEEPGHGGVLLGGEEDDGDWMTPAAITDASGSGGCAR